MNLSNACVVCKHACGCTTNQDTSVHDAKIDDAVQFFNILNVCCKSCYLSSLVKMQSQKTQSQQKIV